MNNKRAILLALASGLLLGLPWTLTPLFFFIFVAWVPLILVESKIRHHTNTYLVFNYAFIAFLLWNIMGTWWIARAQFIGALLIIFANALVQALVFWTVSRVRTILNLPLVITFPIIWMGYEYFHLSWDLAWPWLNLGNAFVSAPMLIQWYEYTGARGGSLWIILTNIAAWKVCVSYSQRNRRSLLCFGTALLILFLVPAVISFQIFQTFEKKGGHVSFVLIQPNLDPYKEKFSKEKHTQHLNDFYRTAEHLCNDDTDFLFGPETLILEQIDEENPWASPAYRQLMAFREKYPRMSVLLGIHSFQKVEKGNIPPGSRFNTENRFYYEAFNTALFLAPNAAPQYYHKTKLVPIFERMPFVQHLGFLGRFSLTLGGYEGTYSNRQENRTFLLPGAGIEILPIVCFESIFGPYCARHLTPQKGFIVMITNDGWWKNTTGYQHHFNFSPVRAIECRRDMIRVANTGISALIDARGRVIAKTPWWQKTTLKGKIHLRQGQTFFAKNGDYLGRFSLYIGILFVFYSAVRSRQKRKTG
jgi:apolipoprotein N-acyltransferase